MLVPRVHVLLKTPGSRRNVSAVANRKDLSFKDRTEQLSLKHTFGDSQFYNRDNVGRAASYSEELVNSSAGYVRLPIGSESDPIASKFNAGVLREYSLSLVDYLTQGGSSRQILLNGQEQSGKSGILLQVANNFFAHNYGVLYIPSVFKYTRNSLNYRYSAEERLYIQAAASQELVQQIVSHNQGLLKTMTLSESLELGPATARQSVDKGTPIADLVRLSAQDNRLSHAVLHQVIIEMVSQQHVPVLVAVDNVQGLFMTSSVRDLYYNPLEAFALSVPRLLLEILAKNVPMAQNVHTVISPGHRAYGKSYALDAFTHLDARRPTSDDRGRPMEPTMLPSSVSQGGPYYPVYREILDSFEIHNVPKTLTLREARGLVDLFARLQVSANPIDDHVFNHAYEMTSGNLGNFSRFLRSVLVK